MMGATAAAAGAGAVVSGATSDKLITSCNYSVSQALYYIPVLFTGATEEETAVPSTDSGISNTHFSFQSLISRLGSFHYIC